MNLFLNTEAAKDTLADFQGECFAADSFVGKCFNQAFVMAKSAVVDVLNYSSEINKFAEEMNINVQETSAFVNTIALLGTIGDPFDETRMGLKSLISLMHSAKKNGFLEFGAGLSVKVTDDEDILRDPLKVFHEIQEKIWKIENPEERMAAASGLKLGKGLTKALTVDRQTYQKKYQEGSSNGVISGNTLDKAEQMNSVLASIKQTWTEIGNMLLGNMINPMKEYSDLIREAVKDFSDPDNGAMEAIQKIVKGILFLLKILKEAIAKLYNAAKNSVDTTVSAFLPENKKEIRMIETMTNEEYALEHNIPVDTVRTIRKNRQQYMETGVMPQEPLSPKKLAVDEWLDLAYSLEAPTMDAFPQNQYLQNKIFLDIFSELSKYNSGIKNTNSSRVVNVHNTINCHGENLGQALSSVVRQSVSAIP